MSKIYKTVIERELRQTRLRKLTIANVLKRRNLNYSVQELKCKQVEVVDTIEYKAG